MPPIARTIADTNVRSHTFRVLSPTLTVDHGMPSSCTGCHPAPPDFLLEHLNEWEGVSPWRLAR